MYFVKKFIDSGLGIVVHIYKSQLLRRQKLGGCSLKPTQEKVSEPISCA
jgi:hypothetical protein